MSKLLKSCILLECQGVTESQNSYFPTEVLKRSKICVNCESFGALRIFLKLQCFKYVEIIISKYYEHTLKYNFSVLKNPF